MTCIPYQPSQIVLVRNGKKEKHYVAVTKYLLFFNFCSFSSFFSSRNQAKYKFDTHAWPNTMNVGCILIACIVIVYHTNLSSSSSSKTFANLFLFFNVVLPIVLYLFFHSYRSGYASLMVIICSIDLLLYVVLLLNGKKKYPILLRCIVVLLLWSIIPLLTITSWFVCRIQQELAITKFATQRPC